MKLTEEEKKSLNECSKLLKDAEKERIKISKKFESFLYNTGACVLIRPTLERGLISYIINILTQIYINANKKKVKFSMQDFSLSNFITITTEDTKEIKEEKPKEEEPKEEKPEEETRKTKVYKRKRINGQRRKNKCL